MAVLKVPAQHGSVVSNDLYMIVFDVTKSEKHTFRMKKTKHPVPRATDMTDFVYREPDQVSVSGIFSNTPMNFDEWDESRASDNLEMLLQVQRAKQRVTLTTGIKVYTNMLILKVNANRSGEPKLEIPVSIDLEEILEYDLMSVFIDESLVRPPEQPRSDAVDEGSVQATDAKPEDVGFECDLPGVLGNWIEVGFQTGSINRLGGPGAAKNLCATLGG